MNYVAIHRRMLHIAVEHGLDPGLVFIDPEEVVQEQQLQGFLFFSSPEPKAHW